MKTLHLLIAILLLHSITYAQVGFGPEVGIGMSSIKFAPPLDPIHYTNASSKPVFSAKAGGMMDVQLNKHMAVQTGVYFESKGGTRSFSYYHNDSFNESIHETLHLYYADVPLSVVYRTGAPGHSRILVGLGAQASYMLGGASKLHDDQVYGGVRDNSTGTYSVKPGTDFGTFDIAVNVFLGYELPTGLFFRAYYTIGSQDIGMNTEVDKNRAWGISSGYIFGKGRNINKDDDNLIDKGDK